ELLQRSHARTPLSTADSPYEPIITLYSTIPPPPTSTLFPYTTLFRSVAGHHDQGEHLALVSLAPADIAVALDGRDQGSGAKPQRSEEHTSELQSRFDLVCRLLLEKKKNQACVSLHAAGGRRSGDLA